MKETALPILDVSIVHWLRSIERPKRTAIWALLTHLWTLSQSIAMQTDSLEHLLFDSMMFNDD